MTTAEICFSRMSVQQMAVPFEQAATKVQKAIASVLDTEDGADLDELFPVTSPKQNHGKARGRLMRVTVFTDEEYSVRASIKHEIERVLTSSMPTQVVVIQGLSYY